MSIPKFYIPCKYCGNTTERSSQQSNVTCFDCKKEKAKARTLSLRYKAKSRVKPYMPMDEWVKQSKHM